MAKFFREKHKVTAYKGQPYSQATIKFVKEHYGVDLAKAPWFGKALAYEAAPTGTLLQAFSGIPGKITQADRHKREGLRVFLKPSGKHFSGWTIVFAHLGFRFAKLGQKVGFDTPLGVVSKTYPFTGAGTGNHIAIYAYAFEGGKKVMKDARLVEKLPAPKPKPPVAPVAPIVLKPIPTPVSPVKAPQKPKLEPTVEKSEGVIYLERFLALIKLLKLDKAWDWLNGKKRIIGISMIASGGAFRALNEAGIIPCLADKCATSAVADFLIVSGTGVMTFGFAHFFVKRATK